MSSRHVRTFRTSAMTTADVAKKRSPGNVRTYRMLRMSDAFWTTSTARLMYFRFLLAAGIRSVLEVSLNTILTLKITDIHQVQTFIDHF